MILHWKKFFFSESENSENYLTEIFWKNFSQNALFRVLRSSKNRKIMKVEPLLGIEGEGLKKKTMVFRKKIVFELRSKTHKILRNAF